MISGKPDHAESSPAVETEASQGERRVSKIANRRQWLGADSRIPPRENRRIGLPNRRVADGGEAETRLRVHMARLGAGLQLLKVRCQAPLSDIVSHRDRVEFDFDREPFQIIVRRRPAPDGEGVRERVEKVIQNFRGSWMHIIAWCCPEDEAVFIRTLAKELAAEFTTSDAYKREAELVAALKSLDRGARQCANFAYNVGQHREDWPSTQAAVQAFDKASNEAWKLIQRCEAGTPAEGENDAKV